MKAYSLLVVCVLAVFVDDALTKGYCGDSASQPDPAANASVPADNSIEQQLRTVYVPTKLTDDTKDIVTTGAVLVLRKDGLLMAPSGSPDTCGNAYKSGGKITANAACTASRWKDKLGSLPIPGADHAGKVPTITTRKFVADEKLYVTKIGLNGDNSIAFTLYSVDFGDARYHATLTFRFGKDVPTAERVLAVVAEVFDAAAPEPKSQTTAQAAAPLDSRPIAVPPPPPTEQGAIAIGDTKEKVEAAFGQPQRKDKSDSKEIYFYKNVTVTFLDDKVTDIQ